MKKFKSERFVFRERPLEVSEGTFSSQDGKAKEDVDLKINIFLVGISRAPECAYYL